MTNVVDERSSSAEPPSPLAPEVRERFISVFGEYRLSNYYGDLLFHHGYIDLLGLPHYGENPDVLLQEMYVEPAVASSLISPATPLSDWPRETSLVEALSQTGRLVVLGDPGSGKSTLVSWIIYQFAHHEEGALVREFGRRIPLPLILRDLTLGPDTTWESLLAEFLRRPVAAQWQQTATELERYLESGQIILLADGLDELPSDATRRAVVSALQSFLTRYPRCLLCATSRVVGYEEIPLDMIADQAIREQVEDLTLLTRSYAANFPVRNASDDNSINAANLASALSYLAQKSAHQQQLPVTTFYLLPFDDRRIQRFLQHWFYLRSAEERQAAAQPKTAHALQPLSEQLFVAIQQKKSIQELARVPNLLTLLALVFRQRRQLPHGRTMLFRMIAEAYLQSIDEARGIRATPYSLQQQINWLAAVAFRMQQSRAAEDGKILARRSEVIGWLMEAMRESHVALGDQEPLAVAAESYLEYLARRSGLLLPRGKRMGEQMYAFQHLSLQDYFASQHLASILMLPRWIDRGVKDVELSPDDMRELSKQAIWRESFVMLFESVADQRGWSDTLSELIWGEDFGELEKIITKKLGREFFQVVFSWELLNEVTNDPYSGLSKLRRRQSAMVCWRLLEAWFSWKYANFAHSAKS